MNSDVHVLSITSGKGGVGKTHTTVNLGLALTKLGKRVLLLDADLGLANINVMLGFEPRANIAEMIDGTASLEDVIVHHSLGFDIIPASSGIQGLTSLSENQRLALLHAVDNLKTPYDYMLIDTAAGIGDNVMYFNVAAEDVVVVVDPEPTSLTDAYALIKVLSNEHNIRDVHILANRVMHSGDGKQIYSQLAMACDRFLSVGLHYLGEITADATVTKSIRAQKPLLEMYPGSQTSIDIMKLAKKVNRLERPHGKQGGVQFFFQSLVGAH